MTLRNKDDRGKMAAERTYVLRVNEKLQIAVLDIIEKE